MNSYMYVISVNKVFTKANKSQMLLRLVVITCNDLLLHFSFFIKPSIQTQRTAL